MSEELALELGMPIPRKAELEEHSPALQAALDEIEDLFDAIWEKR